MKYNEGKACDAILRHLESREGALRFNLFQPEVVADHPAPVELVCEIGSRLFAIEHTRIEPFERLEKLKNEAPKHFKAVEDAIATIVPANEVWELQVPALAFQGLRKQKNIPTIQRALQSWITREAPALAKRRYGDYRQPLVQSSGLIPDVPFEVRLFRFECPPEVGGRMQSVHIFQGDLDASRKQRMNRACKEKFPKLAWWKKNKSARTVFLLEDADILLTNEIIVAETYLSITAARTDVPDETYLLSTCVNNSWTLVPLLINGNSLFQLSGDGPLCHWNVDPETLSPVTNR
ncbi:MAG: hypothetical protein AB7F41_11965 [Methylocystis sp.]|uniref:hypothetical protein n=1 Tax=Methylocystis sp. TaxID=1911079 RepID=UPI003D0CF47E